MSRVIGDLVEWLRRAKLAETRARSDFARQGFGDAWRKFLAGQWMNFALSARMREAPCTIPDYCVGCLAKEPEPAERT
jgi:hypothetical protein